MTGLPREIGNELWGARRAVPLVQAFDALFDHMEHRLAGDEARDVVPPGDLVPLSTGLVALDRVLGGGIWRGQVTIVEADIAAQGSALLNTVGRKAPYPCVVDAPDLLKLVTAILAGSAAIPAISVASATLSELEWDRVVDGLRELRDRSVWVTSVGSIAALADILSSCCVDIVLVHRIDRFGRIEDVVARLADVAYDAGAAVLATADPSPHSPGTGRFGVTRLGMHSFALGGRATLVRPDADELLVAAQVEVDCLASAVR